MLSKLSLTELAGGINLVDLGCSGNLNVYWDRIARWINLYAFDPNRDECQRMAALPHPFASTHFIPAAVAGQSGQYQLHKTRSIYCWSLLKPNTQWLARFQFADLFELTGCQPIEAQALADVDELQQVRIDAIKSDTQGLELPILAGLPARLQTAFLIETETGFCQNYHDETRFHQIARFMEDHDYLLFDINTNHRIPRRNSLARVTRNHQILWCEAIWLKDYVAVDRRQQLQLDRPGAWRALVLCANHGCVDYGFELATLFHAKGLLSSTELDRLREPRAWYLPTRQRLAKALVRVGRTVSKPLPTPFRQAVKRWIRRRGVPA